MDLCIGGANCVFCDLPLHLQATQKLTEVGVKKIEAVSERLKAEIKVSTGQLVHNSCRKRFVDEIIVCRKENKLLESQKPSSSEFSPPLKTRSITTFNFRENCFLCGEKAILNDEEQQTHQVLASDQDFDGKIRQVCAERKDGWSLDVLSRMSCAEAELHAAYAVYHSTCHTNFRSGGGVPKKNTNESGEQSNVSKKAVGRPVDATRVEAFEKTLQYCEKTCEEKEFCTVAELREKMGVFLKEENVEPYTTKYLKTVIVQHFKEKFEIYTMLGSDDVIFLKEKKDEILRKYFYDKRRGYAEDEKLKIVEKAAKFIKSDCLEIKQSSDYYPSISEIKSADACSEIIPKSLLTLMKTLAPGEKNELKIMCIAQAMIQMMRPRALLLPLQVTLGVQMHHLHTSKKLIDILNRMGFCITYKEVLRYEKNAATVAGDHLDQLTHGQFTQFVADNVDHNTNTIDGKNSFHAMGIISVTTPALETSKLVPRKFVSLAEIRQLGKINTHFYDGTEKIISEKYEKLPQFEADDKYSNLDLMWKLSWHISPKASNWSGMMQCSTTHLSYPGKSSISFLPIIDLNPSDYSCVYSTLLFVEKEAKKCNVKPILTFDQPLYWKGVTIISNEPNTSPLKQIILRLGGFHTIMSYLGCIGQFMESSGIEEVLTQIYGENTVKQILRGHHVSRALRAFLLLDAAVNYIFIRQATEDPFSGEIQDDSFYYDSDDLRFKDVSTLLVGLTEKSISVEEACDSQTWNEVEQKLVDYKRSITEDSRNSKLWCQFMEMMNILRVFLRAERTGNWLLHLKSLQNMLPYFAAAGHFLYCKSVRIYLQQMAKLPENSPHIFDKFTAGYHVGRRSGRYWAGLSTDLLIEQVLMKNIKSSGGLTHGSGLTESRRLVWLLGMPACADVNSAMIKLLQLEGSECISHKDSSVARQSRDVSDIKKIIMILHDLSPFQSGAPLKNLASGKVAESCVNVDSAFEIGTKILQSMDEKTVSEFSFKKSDTVKTMNTSSFIKIDDETVQVDPYLLFQRLLCILNNRQENLSEYFTYELCTFPMALCDSSGLLRSPKKPDLVTTIMKIAGLTEYNYSTSTDMSCVIDGGHLLHMLPWPRNTTFKNIFELYFEYVQKHFGKATIVFDRYSDRVSTKDMTHLKRGMGKIGPIVDFKDSTYLTMTKKIFLSNAKNKQKFLVSLADHLQEAGCVTIQAPEDDADVHIILEALQQAEKRPIKIIGNDTDLLVLSLHYFNPSLHKDVIICSNNLSTSTKKNVTLRNVREIKASLGDKLCERMLFCHAFLGCDCTSHIYGIHKGKILTLLHQDESSRDQAAVFYDRSSSKDIIIQAGEKLLVRLYGGKEGETLNWLRLKVFSQKIASSSSRVQPEALPPTLDAAKFHFFRVYLQVMQWLGHELDPKLWGWREGTSGLMPVLTEKSPAPPALLKIIRCSCKEDGCSNSRCSCRKHGIPCSFSCQKCQGISCHNKALTSLDGNEDDFSDDIDDDEYEHL